MSVPANENTCLGVYAAHWGETCVGHMLLVFFELLLVVYLSYCHMLSCTSELRKPFLSLSKRPSRGSSPFLPASPVPCPTYLY